MTSNIIAAAALAALTAGAAPGIQAAPLDSVTTQVTARPPRDFPSSTVHDWNGQRYDVPDNLLRSPGVLINGLNPQPVEFD